MVDEEELQLVELQKDFYRDGFGKVTYLIISIVIAISLLLGISLYVYLQKPKPVDFSVYDEWRVQRSVSLAQPYLLVPDVLQWVSDILQKSFVLDFINYNQELKTSAQYFTDDGWKVFLNQLNIYANYTNVQANRLFINGVPAGAPSIVNEGLLSGRYAWWVQLPFSIIYAGPNAPPPKTLTLQVLVVRVSTLNNLSGVGVDNVIVVAPNTGNQPVGNV